METVVKVQVLVNFHIIPFAGERYTKIRPWRLHTVILTFKYAGMNVFVNLPPCWILECKSIIVRWAFRRKGLYLRGGDL